ncbi:HD-GYP domain-containing protein [Gracilinema caldarium]|uniref:Metal dependent phosphohydrolase n=1 Tax=Gracilinema caldarium (strain ATCC 51460 / DSM 7334 / H1) TaxID=744872 RepID=F8EZZ3_GRAC1|nr:HD-GYP domain-containing protein [Gracilinema caldarium]AEJ18646.1 metal dependent phosphohydrolase [Gracilinema caldarium DSM 7334]
MRKIAVTALRPGQVFTEPVYIQDNNLFVPAGIPVKKKDIDRLIKWGIDSVQTEGVTISENVSTPKDRPEATSSANSQSITPEAPISLISLPSVIDNAPSYRTYTDLINKLDALFQNIAEGLSVESRSIDGIAGRLLQAVREHRDQIVGYILGGEVTNYPLAKSSVNTAILSTLIAMEQKMPNHKILQVTTGALMHDIGMLKLPKDIVEKKGGLSETEISRIQAHPLYAYKMICKELLYPEEVGVIALQHHERWDGEGYPRRLAGEAIDLGARIVSVADAFEAMVSEKPYRNSMIGYQAMKNLLSDNARRFDPEVLKAFIKTMGIYPIGSIVLLNTGAIARVIEGHSEAPLRPKIRILVDEFGNAFNNDEGEIINLLQEKSMFIARAIDPKELAKGRE